MAVEITSGVTPASVAIAMLEIANDAGNLIGGSAGRPGLEMLRDYLAWSERAESRLRGRIGADDLEGLIRTRRHWALAAMDGASVRVIPTLLQELEARRDALTAAANVMGEAVRHWGDRPGLIVLPDTNVFLHQPRPIEELDWPALAHSKEACHLVVPLVVVDELDRHKRGSTKVRSAARRAIRYLYETAPTPGTYAVISEARATTIELIADEPRHVRLPDADDEIVDRAVLVAGYAPGRVRIATEDLGMRTRAVVRGIETIDLPLADDD
jgi:rRNA-processing protein FCF1